MKKFERPPMFVMVLAIGALGLCVAHFVSGEGTPAPVVAPVKVVADKAHDWSREEGQSRDAKSMEDFREGRRASVMDSKEDKSNKDLTRNLRPYGLSPIEMSGGPGGNIATAIKVADAEGVKALIESGGYVAGDRPAAAEGDK